MSDGRRSDVGHQQRSDASAGVTDLSAQREQRAIECARTYVGSGTFMSAMRELAQRADWQPTVNQAAAILNWSRWRNAVRAGVQNRSRA